MFIQAYTASFFIVFDTCIYCHRLLSIILRCYCSTTLKTITPFVYISLGIAPVSSLGYDRSSFILCLMDAFTFVTVPLLQTIYFPIDVWLYIYGGANDDCYIHQLNSVYDLANSTSSTSIDQGWCIDFGASIHVCCDKHMFFDINENAPKIAVSGVSSATMYSQGIGRVKIPLLDSETNDWHNLVLENVHYLPEQPHNLISVKRVLDKHPSCSSPDFRHMVWEFGSKKFQFTWSKNRYTFEFDDEDTSTYDHQDCDEQAVLATGDYQCSTFSIGINAFREYAMLYGRNNHFDVELCSNSYISARDFDEQLNTDSSFDSKWNGRSFFGTFLPNVSMLQKVLTKAHTDFTDKPSNTQQLLVVPYLPKSSFWFYSKYYEILEIIPAKTNDKFVVHRDDYHLFAHLSEDEPLVSADPNYVFLPKLPCSYAVLYRDESTPMRTDDYVKLHLRFGHRSPAYFKALLEAGIQLGNDINVDSSTLSNVRHMCHCESCILTRMKRPSFGRGHRAYDELKPFEYVVSDITGPIAPEAEDGSRYAIHFTCAKTRYTWVRTMESRSETLFYFAEFVDFVKLIGHDVGNISLLKTDNAGEYSSKEFKHFCNEKTITKHYSPAYMHEANGMAEVIWRDISGSARAMLLTAELPPNLWHLAYLHAAWLKNRMPHVENNIFIPFQQCFPHKSLNLSEARVFGSRAYYWLDVDQRYNRQPDLSRHLHDRSRRLV